VVSHAVEPLPEGAVTPSLNSANLVSRDVVADALRRALDRMGIRPKRVALAIPDSVAKVSILKFEKVPERQQDLEELIRWQVRKAAPFRLDDAQLTFVPAAQAADGGREFVVLMARRDIIQEYENVCTAVGAQAGIVDLSTFNVINTVLAGPKPPGDDWLLVHVTADDVTLAILRGSDLAFFRNRAADVEGTLADLVHQTAMYYEDRLNGSGFSRVFLGGAGAQGDRDAEYLRRALEQRLGTRVDPVDTREAAGLADRISAGAELMDALAPLVGLIARQAA
jgi:Tfp pilus assembly PilM family ATPase